MAGGPSHLLPGPYANAAAAGGAVDGRAHAMVFTQLLDQLCERTQGDRETLRELVCNTAGELLHVRDGGGSRGQGG